MIRRLAAVVLASWAGPAGAQIPDACQPEAVLTGVPARPNRVATRLEAGCHLSSFLPESKDAEHWVRAHSVVLRSGGNLLATVSSEAFDAYLRICRAGSNDCAWNDDLSKDTLDAAIDKRFERGRYWILVTGKGGTGSYTLTVSFDGDQSCPKAGWEDLKQPRSGSFADADCRMNEAIRGGSNTNFVHQYRIHIPQRGSLALNAGAARAAVYTPDFARRLEPGDRLAEGTYSVLVESPRLISYTLSARFTPVSCPVGALELERSVAGEFGPECQVRDVRGDDDDSYLRRFRIQAPRPGSLAIRATDAQWTLRDADAGQLAPGSHELWVRSKNLGRFTLTTHFQASCPSLELPLGAEKSAQLTPLHCRQADLPAGGPDNHLQQYDVPVSRRGNLRIAMVSLAFQPYVLFEGKRLETPAVVSVEPKRYRIAAAAERGATGPYTITAEFSCPEIPLPLDRELTGEFSAADCRLSDIVGGEDSSYAHLYRTKVDRQPLKIDCNAPLRIFDVTRRPVAEFSRPGDYYIAVLGKAAGGSYKLLATPECLRLPLPASQQVKSALSETDCRRSAGIYRQEYAIAFREPATLDVGLSSNAFAPALALSTSAGRVAASEGARGERSALIGRIVEPEQYTVEVSSSGPGSGPFVLESHWCAVRGLESNGELGKADCRVTPNGPFMKQYRLQLDRPRSLTVSARSEHFDPRLILLDAGLQKLAASDVGAAPRTASLARPLTPGVYVLQVTSRGVSPGKYTLQVELR